MNIRSIYISRGHNYVGRHGKGSLSNKIETISSATCVAGRGLEGDRFFDHKENFKGQITFFALEVIRELKQAFNLRDLEPSQLRRNVVTEGVDLNELIGREFEVQGIRFLGTEECRPCYWMDEAVCEGAFEWLKGNGGLRARILTSGELEVD